MQDTQWLAGVGIADVTGEPWGVGMMGYGMPFQRTVGIQLRQRARAFAFADAATGQRIVYVVADIGMFFRNVRDAVLARLDASICRPEQLVLTATHTHAGVGGYSCYRLYNMTTDGFRPETFRAIVDGVVSAIQQAVATMAPARLRLARGELHDASVNRSPQSFDRNPDADRAAFPDRIDPRMTLLMVERPDGRLVGALDWFATHGTSLSNRNLLISGDNKGYASYHWERVVAGGDYLDGVDVVTAFAQTTAGDMSPNVPDATRGPTPDDVENARLIGLRQFDAAYALASGGAVELTGGIEARLDYVRLPGTVVDPRWTPDGQRHRAGSAVLGAAFAAGTKEGPGASWCHEGVDANPALSLLSKTFYRLNPRLGDAQSPKAMLLPVGLLRWTADLLPIQIVRLGPLVVVALAQEVTIVAGLRLRRAVAAALDVDADDVIVQGYANDYAGYLTTPEEYGAQRYEGGHTMFGRWQLPVYLQEVTRVATELREARSPQPLPRPRLGTPRSRKARALRPRPIEPAEPASSYDAGDTVRVVVEVPDPRGPVRSNYLAVERDDGDRWTRVADDGDWATTVEWRSDGTRWAAVLTWRIPDDTAGTFRLTYSGAEAPVTTQSFTVATSLS